MVGKEWFLVYVSFPRKVGFCVLLCRVMPGKQRRACWVIQAKICLACLSTVVLLCVIVIVCLSAQAGFESRMALNS